MKNKDLDIKNILLWSGGLLALVLGVRYLVAKRGNQVILKYDVSANQAKISSSTAKLYAERFYNAMKDLGTNQEEITAIYNEISPLGAPSIALIYTAFGVRKYGFFGEPATPFFGSNKDLKEWLRAEVTADNFIYWDALFNKVNKTFNG